MINTIHSQLLASVESSGTIALPDDELVRSRGQNT